MNNNPLFVEWQRLGMCASGIIPSRISTRGEAEDIPDILSDLNLIEVRFRKLLEAYRNEICSSFSEVDRDFFQQATDLMSDGMDQLRDHLKVVQAELVEIETEAVR